MLLKDVPLFKGIGPQLLTEIEEICSEDNLPFGHIVFRKGDFADFLYILIEGEIDITIRGLDRFHFPVDRKGQVFGWSAMVEPRRNRTRAECQSRCRVYKIDGESLKNILEKYPLDALKVMERVAGVIADRYIGKFSLRMGGAE